jgi:hypothetical protein
MGTFNHSLHSTVINGALDKDYPYLEGFAVFFPNDTNVINPILNKCRIGDNPYLPDNFPALGIGVTNMHQVAPNERFFTLLDKLFHDGKDFQAEISDSTAIGNYEICFFCKLSKNRENNTVKEESHIDYKK